MTTLAQNKPRTYHGQSNRAAEQKLPVIANDIIYDGAAVGSVDATGHAGPLGTSSAVRFAGFASAKADNSNGGAAAAISVDLIEAGKIELPVTGAVITDLGRAVYASDDDTFAFSPVAGYFVGFIDRFVSAGVAVVEFDATAFRDPFEGFTHVLKSANFSVAAVDGGKMFWIDTDGVVATLAAVEGINFVRFGNLGAYGAVGFQVSPAAADMIEGPGITAADDKDIINTKATARRQDWIEIAQGDANGWSARWVGTFAREA